MKNDKNVKKCFISRSDYEAILDFETDGGSIVDIEYHIIDDEQTSADEVSE